MTNDDGFYSKGITALKAELEEELSRLGRGPGPRKKRHQHGPDPEPAPAHQPGRGERLSPSTAPPPIASTSPCRRSCPNQPDFVVSGMNLGENLSEDIFFSGTVGGAFSGLPLRHPLPGRFA
ncbi:MAG: 5'/3'-nucleotidase SurE [Candidatus Moduliflexus flocculans]|nr:5'/3'-nucleotidase SurE [Candidatus Moduliflexus flocculans]